MSPRRVTGGRLAWLGSLPFLAYAGLFLLAPTVIVAVAAYATAAALISQARALAIEPTVLLLDEPLSALDAKVRAQLRDEIRRVQLEVGATTLFVTHDQEEALAVADRVSLMNAGRLEQLAPPADVYHRPSSSFVAEFVGLSTKLPATVADGRADVLGVSLPLVGTVVASSFLGAVSRVTVDLGPAGQALAQLPTSEAGRFTTGSRVRVTPRPDAVVVLPPR